MGFLGQMHVEAMSHCCFGLLLLRLEVMRCSPRGTSFPVEAMTPMRPSTDHTQKKSQMGPEKRGRPMPG